MKHHNVSTTPQFKVRTGLRAGDSEDCAKGFQEFVEKCNLSANPELLAKVNQVLAESGINIGAQAAAAGAGIGAEAAEAGAGIGAQWMEFGRSFIP